MNTFVQTVEEFEYIIGLLSFGFTGCGSHVSRMMYNRPEACTLVSTYCSVLLYRCYHDIHVSHGLILGCPSDQTLCMGFPIMVLLFWLHILIDMC